MHAGADVCLRYCILYISLSFLEALSISFDDISSKDHRLCQNATPAGHTRCLAGWPSQGDGVTCLSEAEAYDVLSSIFFTLGAFSVARAWHRTMIRAHFHGWLENSHVSSLAVSPCFTHEVTGLTSLSKAYCSARSVRPQPWQVVPRGQPCYDPRRSSLR